MTKPKRWNGPQKQKPTGKRRPPAPTTAAPPPAPRPLMAPADPIPDEIEVLDEQATREIVAEQTTLGDST